MTEGFQVRLVRGPVDADGGGPALDLAASIAVLRRVGGGDLPTTLRVYRPRVPMVAFGRRDTHRPGFAAAVRSCRAAGFTPVVRGTGGGAVAYTPATLVLDRITAERDPSARMHARFREYGDRIAAVLATVGVDARVGEVPGEYCPGTYSVNAGGRRKLVGTAQRVVRDAWMFSAVVILDDVDAIRPVLTDVYRHLDLPFDPASVGSVRAEVSDVDVDALGHALSVALAGDDRLEPGRLDPDTVALAQRVLPDHEQ